jgi:hemerythrin superfamily protein
MEREIIMTEVASTDIVQLLKSDHEKVKQMFSKINSAGADERESLFWQLVSELVRHEVAEEVVMYPTIRSEAPDGEAEVEPRLEEQAEAEEKLATMEKEDPHSESFALQLSQLEKAVLAHAEAEESNIFPLLRALEDQNELVALGERYEKAKASAPTHPHPHAPDTPPGNKVVGPVAGLFDKARDAAKSL